MCGIVGVLTPADRKAPGLPRGLDALMHRGPDAMAVRTLTGGGVTAVLGHTRLRIIDVSPEADQPMTNEDETVWVSYNGELYNHVELRAELIRRGHRFRSASDTEVLVHLYEESGTDPERFLRRLRGMFAFALFDVARGRLLLARDRLGIKPLYWSRSASGLAFASEVRSLVRAGLASGELSRTAVASYLEWGVVRGPDSIVAGVRELMPGHYLLAGSDQPDPQPARWWRPEITPDHSIGCDADRLLRAVLADSVDRHLVADRAVGVFLSSGIDSGAVATLAARASKLRTLTVTFPDAAGDDDRAGARRLAEQLGTSHEEVPILGRDLASGLPAVLSSMDQPTSDGVNTWLVSRAAAEAGLVVVLSGLGGDELFGGYPTFRLVPRAERARNALSIIPSSWRLAAAHRYALSHPGAPVTRLLTARRGPAAAYGAVRGLLGPADADLSDSALSDVTDVIDARDRVTLLELTNYLPNQLLRDTDQMSMAHSLEARVPLLDDLVVRVALSIPASLRTQAGKAMLGRAARYDAAAPKRPFALPFDGWLRGPLHAFIRDGLLSETLPFNDVVPRPLRERLWYRFEARAAHWSRPWAVSVLRNWPAANGLSW
jgi:asparagine synthase (glutamine-hydrolysing)